MKKIRCIFLYSVLIMNLSGCAYLADMASLFSSGSGTSISTSLDLQNGNNAYTGVSTIEKYNAESITINSTSLCEIIIVLIVGFILSSIIFWWIPQPNHAKNIGGKIKRIFTRKKQ